MKNGLLITLAFAIFSIHSVAQNTEKAEQLVDEGIKLHDQGQYAEAIARYQHALSEVADYPRALYEMSYTYYMTGNYDSTIILSNRMIELKVQDDILKSVYVTLGNAYDDLKEYDKAEDIY